MAAEIEARVDAFLARLAAVRVPGSINPWGESDPEIDVVADAAARRRDNLRWWLLGKLVPQRPLILLVGEAPGYRGARFSGIVFHSERMLAPERRTSGQANGYSEQTATIIAGTLADLGLSDRALGWNAVPLHPFRPGNPLSNRPPTRAEIEAGRPILEAMIDLVRPAAMVAVGRVAGALLPGVPQVRHPAQGGATAFREGLHALAADLAAADRPRAAAQ